MCLYSITVINILCSVRSPIDNTDEQCNFMQKAGIHRLENHFFSTNGSTVYCKENPLSNAILYKMISYLPSKPKANF